MNNLIIIGNGFDLAHGLKTSYHHFIEYLITKTIQDGTFSHTILGSYPVKDYADLKFQFKIGNIQPHNFKNRFIGSLIVDLSVDNWCDIEAKYYSILSQVGQKNALHSDYSSLNKNFEYVRKSLIEYLKEEIGSVNPIESYKAFFKRIRERPTTIINFNYTDTIQLVYSNELQKSNLIHIHGELKNSNNPIVFGYAATNEQSRTLIEVGENEKMRYIKKNLYKRTDNEFRLRRYLDDTNKIDITILGHSCGISDNLILHQIFTHKNVRSIRFFYYQDDKKDTTGEEHFFQTQVNIDRIINDDIKYRDLLVDYTNTIRMPQLKDDLDKTTEFIQYINKFSNEQKGRVPVNISNIM